MPSQFVQPAASGRRLRVLGVDPAVVGATGFGVIEVDGSGARLMRFGAWKLPSNVTFAVRLREIHFLVSGIVQQFAPDAVAVESVFTALNVGTALKLAEMRGVVLACRGPGADSRAQLFAARSEGQRHRLRSRLEAASAADGEIASRPRPVPPTVRRRRRSRRGTVPRANVARPRALRGIHRAAPPDGRLGQRSADCPHLDSPCAMNSTSRRVAPHLALESQSNPELILSRPE